MNYTIKRQADVISLCVSVTALSLIELPPWKKHCRNVISA